ncbi:MAG TPA: hypothetical protein VJV23_01340 [Candidatus Polarisedimenticolia bacterium]|nr:hypothetical protein [Candidatus Polarisedimenticolia bacterium]
MKVKLVLSVMILSLLPLAGSRMAAPAGPAPAEPGADFSAAAVLDSMAESGGLLQGRVRIVMLSQLRDASVEVYEEPRGRGRARKLADAWLARGLRREVEVVVPLQQGVDNELSFVALGLTADGESMMSRATLRVPLDPDALPEQVGDYLQYRGVPVAGGSQ